MNKLASAFVAGLVFAIGLGVSGMTNPEKIIGFLDVAGRWDPSLLFVMAGAIAVHVGPVRWALRVRTPLGSGAFATSGPTKIDAPLVIGAALFGVGWGIAGFCPGPALVDLVAPSTSIVTFVVAMVAGMIAFRLSKPQGDAPDLATTPPSLDRAIAIAHGDQGSGPVVRLSDPSRRDPSMLRLP